MSIGLYQILCILIYALSGLAWSSKLTQPDEPFHFVARWLFNAEYQGEGPEWKKKIAQAMWACPPCVSGQIALWHTLFFGSHDFIFFNILGSVGAALLLEDIHRRLL